MEIMKKKRNQYPKEVFSALTSNKTFSVACIFSPASGTDDYDEKNTTSPYKIYHKRFARFRFTVMSRKDNGYDYADANIKMDEVPELIALSRTASAMDQLFKNPTMKWLLNTVRTTDRFVKYTAKMSQAIATFLRTGSFPEQAKGRQNLSQELKSAVETAKANSFAMGTLKGKTPFQVLTECNCEDAEALQKTVEQLERQKAFLEGNLDKYPNNRHLIAAIEAAVGLVDRGSWNLKPGVLNAGNSQNAQEDLSSLGEIILHEAVPKGSNYTKNESGLAQCYEIGIKWTLGDRYPVNISVRRYNAPIRVGETGQQNVVTSQMDKSSLVANTYNLSSTQWFSCLYNMEANMRRYEMLRAKSQFDEADAIERINKEEQERAQRAAQQVQRA